MSSLFLITQRDETAPNGLAYGAEKCYRTQHEACSAMINIISTDIETYNDDFPNAKRDLQKLNAYVDKTIRDLNADPETRTHVYHIRNKDTNLLGDRGEIVFIRHENQFIVRINLDNEDFHWSWSLWESEIDLYTAKK